MIVAQFPNYGWIKRHTEANPTRLSAYRDRPCQVATSAEGWYAGRTPYRVAATPSGSRTASLLSYVLICTYAWFASNGTRKRTKATSFKHGVDFQTAQLIFDDPYCVTFIERTKDDEPRWHAVGFAEGLILLVVVHTYRDAGTDELIRIISARQATRHERRLYEATHN